MKKLRVPANVQIIISILFLSILIPAYIQISNHAFNWISTSTLIISQTALGYFFVFIYWLIKFLLDINYRESSIGKFKAQKLLIIQLFILGIFSFAIPIILLTYALSSIQPYIISLFSPLVILFIQIFELVHQKTSKKFKLNFLTHLIFWIGYLILIVSTDFWRIVISSFTFKHFLLICGIYLFVSISLELTNQLFEKNAQDDILLPSLIELIGSLAFSFLFCFVNRNFSFYIFMIEISRIPYSILLPLIAICPLLSSLSFLISLNLINNISLKFISYISFPICAFAIIDFMIADSYDVNNFISFSFFSSLAIILNTISITTSFMVQDHTPQRLLI